MKEFITLDQYAMGRSLEYQDEWQGAFVNAVDLLGRVNALLNEIGWALDVKVTSGFRPLALNQKVKRAAKSSYHMIGKAVDFADDDHMFRRYFNPLMDMGAANVLRKYGLFMEHPDSTPTWIHLDTGNRIDRPSRVFLP